MTVYGARPPRWSRPTLRLRLTLLSGVLLLAVGGVLLILAWILIGDAVHPQNELRHGTVVQLADGREVEAGVWQAGVESDARRSLAMRGGLGLLGVGAIGVVIAYLVTGRALRPLHRVTAMARRLSGETLDERINYDGPDDEVAELAGTFDAMLDRIAAAFDSQKRFVANASHELRTPLAVMRTEVDVTMSDPDADVAEFRRMCTVVSDASMRANALVDALLLLARTEAQAGRRLVRKVPADLTAGVAAALSAMGAEARRLNLDVQSDLRPAPVVGDPRLLDRLAGNLIENAVRYNHLGGWVQVRTGSDDRSTRLVVANTGFEVEAADVPTLFEPFRRGGRERTGARGSGLGLSIVRAVCEAHGGTVSAVARAGGGLEVTVTLPAAATTPLPTGTAQVRPPATQNLTPA
ncbi:MAG TPA: HAMP domain-containing sensor histidine kinase [Micromonosporaceae bacterium]|nr:HAMP domain-containing sensor histidine kinase [Micromonosporaceae bacterium]